MEITINDNGRMVSVEATEEVYAFLNYADHKEENLAHGFMEAAVFEKQ